MKTILSVLAMTATLSACGERAKPTMQLQEGLPTASVQVPNRIIVSRVGTFDDDLAYKRQRAVYIIQDTETGKEYIGVSGVGISETGSHTSGKTTVGDER